MPTTQVVLNKKRVSTVLNVDVWDAVQQHADERGEALCDVIEQAIVDHLDLDTTEIEWHVTKTVS